MRDALGSVLIFSVSVFSAVAGIGGGAMMTPILISVFGFNLSAAKMLSHIAVFGNVCAQVGSSFAPSMRRASGSSIDVLTVTIVAPTFLLGHMFGLGVFPMLNDALVEGLLSAVLVIAAALTLRKAIVAYHDRHHIPPPDVVIGEMHPAPAVPLHHIPSLLATCIITCTLAVFTIIALGSNTRPGLLSRCSSSFWVVLASCVPISLSVMACGVRVSSLRARVKVTYPKLSSESSMPFLKDTDVELSHVKVPSELEGQGGARFQSFTLCLLAFAIGAVAGLVGVGGGEFLVPMFLSIGFSHQKSSATSSCLIALAMLTDAVSYLRGGELQPYFLYAPWLYALPLTGALLGKMKVSKHLTSPAKRAWLLASLFLALCVCCVLALVQAAASASSMQSGVFAVRTSLFC